jgi:hypothetical protein
MDDLMSMTWDELRAYKKGYDKGRSAQVTSSTPSTDPSIGRSAQDDEDANRCPHNHRGARCLRDKGHEGLCEAAAGGNWSVAFMHFYRGEGHKGWAIPDALSSHPSEAAPSGGEQAWRVVELHGMTVATKGEPAPGVEMRNLQGMCELANAAARDVARLEARVRELEDDIRILRSDIA